MDIPKIAVEQKAKLIHLEVSFPLCFATNFAFGLFFINFETNYNSIVIVFFGDDFGTSSVNGEFFIDSVKLFDEGFGL